MFRSLRLFGKASKSICVLDCASGEVFKIEKFPAALDEQMRPAESGTATAVLVSVGDDGDLCVSSDRGDVFVNSAPLMQPRKVDAVLAVSCQERAYYISADPSADKAFRGIDLSKWLIFYSATGMIENEMPFAMLKQSVFGRGFSGEGMAVCPSNFGLGFSFLSLFAPDSNQARAGGAEAVEAPVLAQSARAITCPLCWLKFDLGDALSVAAHESLRGDPTMGPYEMRRFLPTEFNEDGVPFDAAGAPAPDVACPHCLGKLPPNYLELDNKIFSLVGAPSSGKSYYLSALIKKLPERLGADFGVLMKDLDPSGNVMLTQMKNKLFSARRPEDAVLEKTAYEGAMYQRCRRFGKMVALPKPLSYLLTAQEKPDTSIIFYDNAGEHFEPGVDLDQSPGAMHVASSDAIFLLFDPATNPEFRRVLGDYPDPQLLMSGAFDQQGTIVSEMQVRIKRVRGLDAHERIQTPLAVIIGKSDMWEHLLKTPLRPTVEGGALCMDAIDYNSALLERFLRDMAPDVVGACDALSSNVRYFAASALGHSPMVIEGGFCAGRLAPIPEKIKPENVDVPVLWALSQTTQLIRKQ